MLGTGRPRTEIRGAAPDDRSRRRRLGSVPGGCPRRRVDRDRTDATVLSVHIGDDDQGRAILEEAAAVISTAEVEVATRLEAGTAHARLIEIANEVGAALLTSGARGVRGVKALGSVSERVAHQASCSVLIIRRGIAGA